VKGTKKYNYWWIWLGLSSLVVKVIFSLIPSLTETIYSRGLFVIFRCFWDYLLSWIPFPLVYILFTLLIYVVIFKGFIPFVIFFKKKKKPFHFKGTVIKAGNIAGFIISWFLISWGFNYNRISARDQLDINVEDIKFKLEHELTESIQKATFYRSKITNDNQRFLNDSFIAETLEDEVRVLLTSTLKENGYPTPGKVRCKRLQPSGILRSFGIVGMYIPFCSESYVDNSFGTSITPFTMAHEMAHGYGITDEGEASFFAYLACEKSNNPIIRYSGEFDYLFQLFNERAKRIGVKKTRKEVIELLPKGIIADYKECKRRNKHYTFSFLSDLGSKMNDAYLKSQGIAEGIDSYNEMIQLIVAWRQKYSVN